MFLDDELTIKIIRKYLCFSISRNGVSTNSTLFELSLSIFLLVIRHFRHLLKVEVGILFDTVYFHILEMSNSTFKQKSLLLQALLKICENPQILSDMFINYDCDLNSVSLFEKSVTICCKLAQSKLVVPDTNQTTIYNIASIAIGFENKNDQMRALEKKLRVQSVACLAAIAKSMVIWSTHKTFQSRGVDTDDTYEDPVTIVAGKNPLNSLMLSQFDHSRAPTNSMANKVNARKDSVEEEEDVLLTSQASRKQRFSQGVLLFNQKPMKGITSLIDHGLLSLEPKPIAEFLLSTPDISKASIGEYIGDGDIFNKTVMHEFIDLLNLESKGFVEALRFMLQTFRLPGEAVKNKVAPNNF